VDATSFGVQIEISNELGKEGLLKGVRTK